ncbi:HK97 gp10 family phage protein [Streptomyces sp. DSM 44915]|uniref:HK97 gp10 family phage protein n=1 Tax=Streptomyces chisholmiae TaxID=3075540 RepID=A0ABU2JZ17_9ACTN|nr:HK97-gp10 family putative phage morphogenesis protein [Streptomyces sp. DSM 44915]MDT0270256.1 HK97 gp10 family phage protein [Streptomyces sp. DSM 44915]
MRLEGIEGLRDRLEELPDEVRAALRRAVREAAEDVRAEVRAGVRVDTGRMRDAVDITYRDTGLTARVGWDGTGVSYAQFQEFGTSSIPANPQLQPALERERGQITGRIRDEVKKVLP